MFFSRGWYVPAVVRLRGVVPSMKLALKRNIVTVTESGISVRAANAQDIPFVRCCNHACLPEHYTDEYIDMNLTLWPNLFFVAEKEVTRRDYAQTCGGAMNTVTEMKLLGYIMGKTVFRTAVDLGETYYRVPTLPAIVDSASLHEQQRRYYEHQARSHLFMKSSPEPTTAELTGTGGTGMVGFVTSTAVYPAFRGLGVAAALMSAVHAELRRTGTANEVLLHCRVSSGAPCCIMLLHVCYSMPFMLCSLGKRVITRLCHVQPQIRVQCGRDAAPLLPGR